MKRLFACLLLLLPAVCRAVPQPYPIAVDSQLRSVPSLEMYQAESYTVRATFKSGGTNEDVSATVPFMYWATSANATNYVTSSWSRVSGGTNGVIDFTFAPAALNTNGDFIYGVGAGATFRQGSLRIRANPYASGVATPTFTLATNLAGVSFLNYPWLDGVTLTESTSNSAAVSGNSLLFTIKTNYSGSSPNLSGLSNAVLASVTNRGATINGSAISNGAAISVGTITQIVAGSGISVSQGQGPSATISAVGQVTNASGSGRLGLGVSSGVVTGYLDASGLSTGALYSISGNGRITVSNGVGPAAGLYFDATGLATSGQWNAQIANMATTGQWAADISTATAGLGTGSVGTLSGYMPSAAVTSYVQSAAFPLASGQNLSGRVDTVEGAYISGAEASNRFIKAYGNTVLSGSIFWTNSTYSGASGQLGTANGTGPYVTFISTQNVFNYQLQASQTGFHRYNASSGAKHTLWDSGNDGTNSTLDAAYLGGRIWTNYLTLDASGNLPGGSIGTNITYNGAIDLQESYALRGASEVQTAAIKGMTGGATVIDVDQQSAGSTALWTNWNADLLDGLSAGYFTSNTTAATLAIGAGATNLALAIGAGNSNLTIAAHALSSNAYDRAVAAHAAISNDTDEAWSGSAATTTVNLATNRIAAASGVSLVNNASQTNAFTLRSLAGQLVFNDSTGTARTVVRSDNLSSLGVQTVSGFNSAITNYWREPGTIPTNATDVGAERSLTFSGTNGYAKYGGVWHRFNTTTNWP